MAAVIILDGHLKSALASVRSLGARGVTVVCGAERGTAPALHSRFVSERFVYPSPKRHPRYFLAAVERKARALYERDGERPVVFGFSDATTLLLSRERDAFAEVATLPMPSAQSVETAADKAATYTLAESHHIPTIKTYGPSDFHSVAFPAIVKNRHSILWRDETAVAGSARFILSREELDDVYGRITREATEAPLVQDFIEGEEYGVEMACASGQPLAVFVHRRIRSLSPRGGAAVVKETAPATEQTERMEQYARALVRALSWEGPVMVEFKVERTTGAIYLMEINGRFWGSLPLAIAAGVDFPWIAYERATGASQKLQASIARPAPMRTRHFLGDCKWLLAVFFAYDPLRSRLYPKRLSALYNFKMEFFRSKGDIFSLRDPLPSLMEYSDLIAKLIWK
jgi:predicted ATP-grasp superfamily ATP-dependent carboligase